MKDITGGEFVGDFRNGYIDFGWDNLDEDTKLKKRAIELNQGRAAQMGILALVSLWLVACAASYSLLSGIDGSRTIGCFPHPWPRDILSSSYQRLSPLLSPPDATEIIEQTN